MYDDSDGEDDRPFNKANFSSSSGDVEMSVVDAAQQLQGEQTPKKKKKRIRKKVPENLDLCGDASSFLKFQAQKSPPAKLTSEPTVPPPSSSPKSTPTSTPKPPSSMSNDLSSQPRLSSESMGSTTSDYTMCTLCDPKSDIEHIIVTTRIRVMNLCCAGEEAIIVSCMNSFKGVESVNTNVVGRYCLVKHCPEICCAPAAAIVDKLNANRLGASIQEVHDNEGDGASKGPSIEKVLHAVFVTTFFIAAVVSEHGYHAENLGIGFYAVNIFFGSLPVIKKAFETIYYQHTVNIHVLMTVAIVGAIAINDVKDAAIVVTLFILAELLEEYIMGVVRNAIKLSAKGFSKTAILAQSGEQVPIDSLKIGDVVAVRAGDMIPVDGCVSDGSGVIDESALTGEATPVAKRSGAKVISGTVVQNGYLEVVVEVEPQNSTLRRMNQAVEDVQADRGKLASVVDKFALYWTPLILIASFLFFIIGGSATGDWKSYLYKALVLLVLACPCAVVLAAPIACVCGIAGAAKYGVLIKGSSVIEMLGLIDVVAVDKTGTLTKGFFSIIDKVSLTTAQAEMERAEMKLPKLDALQLAAAVEAKSAHPLANAIVAGFCGCIADMDPSKLPNTEEVKVIDGVGLQGMVTVPGTDEIVCVTVGNERLFKVNGGNCSLSELQIATLDYFSEKNRGCTIVIVSIDDRIELAIALGDSIRPESATFVNKLKSLKCEVSMLTGDHKDVAEETCLRLGIDNCHARLLPENKLELVESAQKLKHHVLMLGDGINDATALAAASVGTAMGAGGAAMAVSVADMVLMTDNLLRIPSVIAHGRFVRALVLENVLLSILLKFLAISLALAGILELWTAVLFDIGSLVFVVCNGCRALLAERTFAVKVPTEEEESISIMSETSAKAQETKSPLRESMSRIKSHRQSVGLRASMMEDADGIRNSVFSSLLITEEKGAVEMIVEQLENQNEERMSLIGGTITLEEISGEAVDAGDRSSWRKSWRRKSLVASDRLPTKLDTVHEETRISEV